MFSTMNIKTLTSHARVLMSAVNGYHHLQQHLRTQGVFRPIPRTNTRTYLSVVGTLDDGHFLYADIVNDEHVAKAVKVMKDPHSKHKIIMFREVVAEVIDVKGNQAVRDHIAPALERCKIPHIFFSGCDLSIESAQLLANAVEKNTEMSAFTCEGNRIDNAKTDEIMKQAIINTKAPIIMWNWNLLPRDVMEAIKLRAATSSNVTVDNVPSAKKLASVNEALSKGRMKANQMQATLDEEMKESDEQMKVIHYWNDRVDDRNDGLYRLCQFTELHQRIKETKLALEHTRAVNLKNEKILQSVDDFKGRVAHLFPAPLAVCNKKNHPTRGRKGNVFRVKKRY